MIYNKYNSWKKSISLNESIRNAKDYYLSYLYRNEKLDPENKSRQAEGQFLASDDDWTEVVKLINDNNVPGYTTLFLKFKIEQGASLDKLNNIMKLLIDPKIKDLMDDYLRMPVNKYGKVKHNPNSPDSDDRKPGYERLGDDLTQAVNAIQSDWLVKALSSNAAKGTFNQRKEWKDAPIELKDEILTLAKRLDDLGIKKNFDARADFLKKLLTIDSIEGIKTDLIEKIKAIDEGIKDIVNDINKLADGEANILWEGTNKLVVSFRSPDALGRLCAATSWCIRPERYGSGYLGQWYSYISEPGYIQYVLFDFGWDGGLGNKKAWQGITVKQDGIVYAGFWKNDDGITGLTGSPISDYIDEFTNSDFTKSEMQHAHNKEVEYSLDHFYEIKKKEDIIIEAIGSVSTVIKRDINVLNTLQYKKDLDYGRKRERTLTELQLLPQSVTYIIDEIKKNVSDELFGFIPLGISHRIIDILDISARMNNEEVPSEFVDTSIASIDEMISRIEDNIQATQVDTSDNKKLIKLKEYILDLKEHHNVLK